MPGFHCVELNATLVPGETRIGAILTIGREPSTRSVDKTIAAYAARNDGFYAPQEHYELARMTARIPGSDVEGHIEAHVSRLEALRRAGIVGRLDADHWNIPRDYLERAAAYDEREGRKLVVEVHSTVALDRQITAEAATWLDRQLVGRHRVETAPMGFGHQVQQALERRKQQLLTNGLAKTRDDGSIQYQPDLFATLQRRELDRVGQNLAAKRTDGMSYVLARDGSVVRGTYRRAIALTSGKVAVIQRDEHFTLLPWRAILERHRGREVVRSGWEASTSTPNVKIVVGHGATPNTVRLANHAPIRNSAPRRRPRHTRSERYRGRYANQSVLRTQDGRRMCHRLGKGGLEPRTMLQSHMQPD
jgi:hypothetical protein